MGEEDSLAMRDETGSQSNLIHHPDKPDGVLLGEATRAFQDLVILTWPSHNHWGLVSELKRKGVTVPGPEERGHSNLEGFPPVASPPTPPHNVADLSESVMASSCAATLRSRGVRTDP